VTMTCQTCRAWEPNESGSRGLCRYAPPRSQIVLVGSDDLELKAVWATTSREDRCGAWAGTRLPMRASDWSTSNRRPPVTASAFLRPSDMEK
jgi:hypothetical protein